MGGGGGGGCGERERCVEIQKTKTERFAANEPFSLYPGGGRGPLYNYEQSHGGANGPSKYE